MMLRRSAGTKATLVVALVLAAAPLPAYSVDLPMLVGDVLLMGASSARLDFRVTKTVQVIVNPAVAESDQVEIEGEGHVVGALIADRTPGAAPRVLHFLSIECNLRSQCAPGERWEFVSGVGFYDSDASKASGSAVFTIPRGEYQLILVAEQGPAEVRLRFPALEGSATWIPDASAEVSAQLMNHRSIPSVNGPTHFSLESRATQAGRFAFLMSDVQYEQKAGTYSPLQRCLYKDRSPPGGYVLPGCALAAHSGSLWDDGCVCIPPASKWSYVYEGLYTLVPGDWTLGWSFTSVAEETWVEGHSLFVGLYADASG